MKGVKAIAKKTASIVQHDKATWIPVYYSFSTDTVYMEPGENRYLVTNLINKNDPCDIEELIDRWKCL